MKFEQQLRNFASSNPLAYKAWFLLYRYRKSPKPTLPAAGDCLYIDGYPRSGNTYFTAAIKHIYADIHFANHLHQVAPIKIALQKEVPTFLLMRNPEEAIASYFQHVRDPRSTSLKSRWNDKDLCYALAVSWLLYYTNVSRLKEEIYLISADSAFQKPELAVKRIVELSRLSDISDLDEKFASFDRYFKKHDSSKAQGSTSFPDSKREEQKNEIRKLVRTCDLLEQCWGLHQTLLVDSIVDA